MSTLKRSVDKRERREKRAFRVRKKIHGTAERPRLSVFRSLKHIYAQIIDDEANVTIASASTRDKDIRETIAEGKGGNAAAAAVIGKAIAEKAVAKGVKQVAFDRGSYKFHGRVKALAEAAEAGGLQFLKKQAEYAGGGEAPAADGE